MGGSGGRPALDAGASGPGKRARAEARRSGLRYVGTEHLILAVLGGEGPAGDYLRRRGITPERLTAELRALASRGMPEIISQILRTADWLG